MIDLLEAVGFAAWSYARIVRTGKYPRSRRYKRAKRS